MSKIGKELANKLILHFGGFLKAAKGTGFDKTTLEKWKNGERSPRLKNLEKCEVLLQSDNPQAREARILDYQQQVSESGRIIWNKLT